MGLDVGDRVWVHTTLPHLVLTVPPQRWERVLSPCTMCTCMLCIPPHPVYPNIYPRARVLGDISGSGVCRRSRGEIWDLGSEVDLRSGSEVDPRSGVRRQEPKMDPQNGVPKTGILGVWDIWDILAVGKGGIYTPARRVSGPPKYPPKWPILGSQGPKNLY